MVIVKRLWQQVERSNRIIKNTTRKIDAEMKEVFPASKVQKNFKNKRDN